MKGPPNAVPTYIADANSFSFQIMIMTNKERVVNKSIIKSNNFSFELWFQPTNKLGVLDKKLIAMRRGCRQIRIC